MPVAATRKRSSNWPTLPACHASKTSQRSLFDLLERAGVDTVKKPAKRKPDNPHATITETNATAGLTKRPPGVQREASRVEQAEALSAFVPC